MKAFIVCFLVCIGVFLYPRPARAAASGLYSADAPGLTILDEKNFADEVEKSDQLWVVQFYAPWCPHSKRFVKEFLVLAKELQEKGLARAGVVNASENKMTKRKFKIDGYPTVMFFGKDKTKVPLEYKGARKTAKIIEALLEKRDQLNQ